MKMIITAGTAALAFLTAAAAQEAAPGAAGSYFAVGAQFGGEAEFCDEDEDCGSAGFSAFGRYGYKVNPIIAVEADVGLATGGETFFHAAALGALALPLGPVDLRLRAGPALFSADDETRFGVAYGPGIGFRPSDQSAIRADLLVFTGDETDEGAGIDIGGLLQVGYERRF